MKKNLPLYVYGAVIIFAGVFLLYSKQFTFQTIKLTLGISLIIGAILAFLKALSRKRKQVEFSYHEINALSMMVYGFLILLLANNIEKLLYFSTFLMFFYAFSEIIFCNWLFNLRKKVIYKIIILRIILALIVGVGTILIMYYNTALNNLAIEGFGILFIIIGLNILLYIPVINNNEIEIIDKTSNKLS